MTSPRNDRSIYLRGQSAAHARSKRRKDINIFCSNPTQAISWVSAPRLVVSSATTQNFPKKAHIPEPETLQNYTSIHSSIMGRITIFGTDHCPHCIKAKGALEMRGIPYTDIDISKYPHRRQDMVSLSEHGASTVPQIFFNEQHVGGAEDLLQVLEDWDKTDTLETAYSLFKLRILDSADPTDDRLAPVSGTPRLPRQLFSIPLKRICLPDGTTTTARELLPRLEQLLQPRDRPWKAHWFKKCFLNTTAVSTIQDEFHVPANVAITFLRELQLEHGLLHHVCEDHVFHCRKGGKILFFRLAHHQLPHILNSYLTSWKHSTCSLTTTTQVSLPPEDLTQATPMETILDLERRLYLILNRYTDHNGLTDYLKVAQDNKMVDFEIAACSLQGTTRRRKSAVSSQFARQNVTHLLFSYPSQKSSYLPWTKQLARPFA